MNAVRNSCVTDDNAQDEKSNRTEVEVVQMHVSAGAAVMSFTKKKFAVSKLPVSPASPFLLDESTASCTQCAFCFAATKLYPWSSATMRWLIHQVCGHY